MMREAVVDLTLFLPCFDIASFIALDHECISKGRPPGYVHHIIDVQDNVVLLARIVESA